MSEDVRTMRAALARVKDERRIVHAWIGEIVGRENVERVFSDDALLPLLRPVLRSKGKDLEAVARLRRAFHVTG